MDWPKRCGEQTAMRALRSLTDMKPQAQRRMEDLEHGRVEADVEATVNVLFKRWPTLCGFSVRAAHIELPPERASALFVTDVIDYPWSGPQPPANLYYAIVAALAELTDACPEAGELLRERSFARVFH